MKHTVLTLCSSRQSYPLPPSSPHSLHRHQQSDTDEVTGHGGLRTPPSHTQSPVQEEITHLSLVVGERHADIAEDGGKRNHI